MSKSKVLEKIVESMNAAPSGSFVAITDYVSEDGTVKTVQGQIGVRYEEMKKNAIAELKQAIEAADFEEITVKGQCWADADEDGNFVAWNSRKSKDRKLLNYCETYTPGQVLNMARDILYNWENPKPRANNKVQLTDKNDGLSFNTETLSLNFSLVVFNEYYKEDKTAEAKAGMEVKIKASHPDTKVKDAIRKRFEKKYKAFTIASGKFASLSIAGTVFEAEEIIL